MAVKAASPRVVVIGAGLGGVTMAVKLKKAGFTDFVVLEAEDGPGGTWWINRYPGAEVDVNSAVYSLPYRDHVWSRTHAKQPELLRYIDETLDLFEVREHFRFGVRVQEVRWDDGTCTHTVTTSAGERLEAEVVVSAVGMLSDPKEPSWPGIENFKGRVFHTQRWPDDVDLTGKRVAVVGTGASSVQVVPSIAPDVKQLYVFQREPGWVLPKNDRDYTDEEIEELTKTITQRWRRLKMMAKAEWSYLYSPVYLIGAGISGFDLPELIKTLLFVAIDGGNLASRFANGRWSDLPQVLPLVNKLVRQGGWIPYVADQFVKLCERAGGDYPAEAFADLLLAQMTDGRLPSGWKGTRIPAAVPRLVQAHADREHPLHTELDEEAASCIGCPGGPRRPSQRGTSAERLVPWRAPPCPQLSCAGPTC